MPELQERLTVGVYSPYLQGFYYGELIGQIQQLCLIKGYDFSLIATHGFGTFASPIHSENLDIVILLRNAIHNDLAAHLIESNKSVVSIAYDYFPLEIPTISCDNEAGIEQAFNYLLHKGHSQIAYLGDLQHFDLRKRYEAYCDQHEINQIPFMDNNVFPANDTLFSGGHRTAEEFVSRGCRATGVIAGAALTGIGFSQRLKRIAPGLHSNLDIVVFDAISIVPAIAPELNVVDQNMYLIAHEALSTAEKGLESEEALSDKQVQPKLIPADSELRDSNHAFLATSVEISELHNPHYMKTIISNFYEWPHEISKSKLDDLLMLEPLFPRYLHEACFAKILYGKSGAEYTKTKKVISLSSVKDIPDNDKNHICKSDIYPKATSSLSPSRYNNQVHVPILHRGKLWGILSVFGENEYSEAPCSMVSMCGYICNVADDILKTSINEVQASVTQGVSPTESSNTISGTIDWDIPTNTATWSIEALSILGFSGSLERNIYQHMEITDRIHEEDEILVRSFFLDPDQLKMKSTVRFRHKNKAYIETSFSCNKSGDKIVCSIEASTEND